MSSHFGGKAAFISAGLLIGLTSDLGTTSVRANPTPNQQTRIVRTLNINQIKQPVNLGGYQVSPAMIQQLNRNFNRKVDAIRRIPNLTTINSVNTDIAELNNGLVIRSNLAYTIRLGACNSQKSALRNAGIDCGIRTSLNQSIRQLSQKSSPQYISNPKRRNKAIKNLRQSKAEVLQDAKKARESLKDPKVIESLGKETVLRLSRLSDEDLAIEAINASEQVIEERVFIPKLDNFTGLTRIQKLRGNTLNNLKINKGISVSPGAAQRVITANQRTAGNLPRTASREDIFLTGFTLGKEYEWRKRWSTSIKWCWVGCKKTYYVEPYANFSYGLGLRFPIQAKLEFTGQGNRAYVQPTLTAIDAEAAQYRQAGLGSNQLFDGQELVAEMSARAGVEMKLPYVGRYHPRYTLADIDFTDRLRPPFQGGNFRPPSPGRPLPTMPEVFVQEIDLLGGLADYGVAWAKLHPGIKSELMSNNLNFKLKDNFSNNIHTIRSGDRKELTVRSGKSSVTLYNPEYNIAFTITPGVQYNVGVDFGVWGKTWRDEIWIPQLAISLPPGGARFTCHANTQCSRNYEFNVTSGATSSGSSGGNNAGSDSGPSDTTARRCDAGRYLGRYALRSNQTGKFIRAGVGSNSVMGAVSSRIGGNRSWETFDIYELSSRNSINGGTLALRSTQDPGRWVSVANNREKLRLRSGCTTATRSRLFNANRRNSTLQLQSLQNRQWVILRSDNYLYANAPGLGGNVPRALEFTMLRQQSAR